jgi:hypothetical protein
MCKILKNIGIPCPKIPLLSPVIKSRVYKLVGYVPYEIYNSNKVWNISFAPIGSHSGTLPLKLANLGLKYWGLV